MEQDAEKASEQQAKKKRKPQKRYQKTPLWAGLGFLANSGAIVITNA